MQSPGSPLDYPFQDVPKPGEAVQVRERLWWARMPLPFRLNHVNLWFLEDDDGWTVVDAGANTPDVRAAWETLAPFFIRQKPLRRMVLTHGHMDHVGAASWVVQTFGIRQFHSTPLEWHATRTRWYEARNPPSDSVLAFYRRHASCDIIARDYARDMASIASNTTEPPDQMARLVDQGTLSIGGRTWTTVVAGGHADAHASFHSHDAILIAGDQILDRITPVVGVFPWEPLGDPLTDYLVSLERFRPLAEQTLVLPSHGRPFIGLHRRLTQLAKHHERRLQETVALVRKPASARTVAMSLFHGAMEAGQARLGLAETLSHLHRLIAEGRARRLRGDDNTILFEAI